MKLTLHKIRIGDLLWAQVVELMGSNEMIVSFQGDLIRVKNLSFKKFGTKDKALVRVTEINPLALQLVDNNDRRQGATRINVEV